MRLKVLPYVTIDVDDRLRIRLQSTAERVRVNLRAYLLSAADDVDTAGDRMRDTLDAAVSRVDDAVSRVADRLDGRQRRQDPDSDVPAEANVEAS